MSYYRANPLDEIKQSLRASTVLTSLILVNTGVWVLVKIIEVLFFLFNHPGGELADAWVVHYLALPALVPLVLSLPWTLVTYMFLHIGFWHILFNMLWLYWFGRIFLEFMNQRQLLVTYLLGGLSGGLLYILAFNIFPVFATLLPQSVALGASASVMAIVVAAAFYVPDYAVQLILFGRVRIIYLAVILFIIDFFTIPSGNPGGHIAHIGGALFGFFYVLVVKKGRMAGTFRIPGGISAWMQQFFHPRKMHATGPATSSYERPRTDEDYNFEKNQRQKRIDSILDKIAKGGYDSLTREEKEFLFKSSGKKQQ
jgi:membrane associated rhomboid family serine protease